MAITASGLFVATWRDVLDVTQLALDLDAETHKGALFTNSITPNFSTDTVYGSGTYATNETSGGAGWSAGGVALTGTTILESSTAGGLTFDATDVSQSTTTLTNAECYVLYIASGLGLIVLIDFTTPYSTSSGTFAITWAAPASGGIFTIDLTP